MELTLHSGVGLVVLAFMIFVMKWVVDNSTRFMRRSAQPVTDVETTSEQTPQVALEELNAAMMVKEADLIPTLAVKEYELHEEENLDEHLSILTKKLAEKEGCLQLSRSKIRETQHEIQSLNAVDHEVKSKYRDIMEVLKKDLTQNELECKKLHEQIEWVSMRRAELKEEVRQSQKVFGEAATDLASNLMELQRGRVLDKPQEENITEKYSGLRNRKEPQLPEVSVSDISYHEPQPIFPEPQNISVHRIEAVEN